MQQFQFLGPNEVKTTNVFYVAADRDTFLKTVISFQITARNKSEN